MLDSGTRTGKGAALRGLGGSLLVVLLAAVSGGCGTSPQPSGTGVAAATVRASASATTAQAQPGTAVKLLAALPVKGRAPRTGYARSRFGAAWNDTDHNGCDQRNDVLRRDLRSTTLKAGTHGCTVMTGTLRDPYTGRAIAFDRSSDASAVQIDHVVALGDAWVTGAQAWTASTRLRFANDPLNLLAVDGPVNEAKGDGDAATWLPPAKSYRCSYVARQVAVKAAYRLWVTGPEREAMARVLSACPGERSPVSQMVVPLGGAPVATRSRTTTPPPATVPRQRPAPPAPAPTSGSSMPVVHPGAFCAPAGAWGVTDRGTAMRCSYRSGDPHARWRAA